MSQMVPTTGFILYNLLSNLKFQTINKLKDQDLYKQLMQTVNGVLEYAMGAGVAVFPSIGFVYQYRLINARKSIGTFSINVCGVMLLSNFLRIAFYIYKQFSIALLLQSILNISMQFLLLNLCVKTMNIQGYFQKNENSDDVQEEKCLKNFWKWKQINKYFAVGASLILSLGVFIRKYDIEYAGQSLGYAALTAQTFLLIPQILQNLKQERVKGISYIFIALNTFQDLLELVFVLLYSQPIQFVIFNSLQVITNVLLIIQIVVYKNCYKKGQQKEEEKEMVQHHQHHHKHEQILSGHHIIHPVKKRVNQSSKHQHSPLKGVEEQIQKKQSLSIIVE